MPLLQCEWCKEDFTHGRALHEHMEGVPRNCLRAMGLTTQEWRARFARRQRRARHLKQVSGARM